MMSMSILETDKKKKEMEREFSSWRASKHSPSKSPISRKVGQPSPLSVKGLHSERKTVFSVSTTSQPKTSKSYVREKKLNFDYEMPDIEIPDFYVSYDLKSVVKKINEYEMWETQSAKWVLEALSNSKSVLLAKGSHVMALPTISQEVILRLMNLRNCVNKQ